MTSEPHPHGHAGPPGRGDADGAAATGGLDVTAALAAWLPGRRWFPAKGTDVAFDQVARITLGTPGDGPEVFVEVLRALGAGPDGAHVVLHVPLVLETAPGAGAGVAPAGLVAQQGGTRLYDGAYHPAFVAAWLDVAQWSPTAPPVRRPYDLRGLHVLTGEQSNTSVLLPHVGGGTMLKVLRSLAPGQNPDIVVPLALTQVGWAGVPAPFAWTELEVPDPGPADEDQSWVAHSGVLAEFVPGASDGFELACSYAAQGRPFDNPARELGSQVAQMHSALRQAFPAEVSTPDVDWLLTALRRRVRTAAGSSVAVSERGELIEGFLAHMRTVADDAALHGRSLPPVQRIHGDLHLGQALYSPRTGWRILDFEGEPLRPLRERTRPDLGERDVAGMLRSFDYASAVGQARSPEWARSARRAFLEGYTGYLSIPGVLGFGQPPSLADRVVVLDAFELDKALYEVVYEERNRPTWMPIPLGAIDRILESAGDAAAPAAAGDDPVAGPPAR